MCLYQWTDSMPFSLHHGVKKQHRPHLGIPYHTENTPRMASPDHRSSSLIAEVWKTRPNEQKHINIKQHITSASFEKIQPIFVYINKLTRPKKTKTSWQHPLLTRFFVGDDFFWGDSAVDQPRTPPPTNPSQSLPVPGIKGGSKQLCFFVEQIRWRRPWPEISILTHLIKIWRWDESHLLWWNMRNL